jgi:hypothetical protein
MTAFPKTMPAVVIEIALTAVAAALVALRIDVAPTRPASKVWFVASALCWNFVALTKNASHDDDLALAVLQQHHLADGCALHQPVGAAEIELLQRRQHVDEVVPADHALRCGGNLLDLAGAAGGKGAAGIGGEAARLLDAVADHEGAGPDESVLIINDLRR